MCYNFFFRNLFPDNLVRATFQQVHTTYIPKSTSDVHVSNTHNYTEFEEFTALNLTQNDTTSSDVTIGLYNRVLEHRDAMNVLGKYTFTIRTVLLSVHCGSTHEPTYSLK